MAWLQNYSNLSIPTALHTYSKPTQHDLNWSNKFFNKKVLETRSHRNQNVIHFKFIQQQFAAGCKCAEVNRRMWFKCRCHTKPLMSAPMNDLLDINKQLSRRAKIFCQKSNDSQCIGKMCKKYLQWFLWPIFSEVLTL